MNKESLKMALSETTGNFLLENIHTSVHGTGNLKIAREHLSKGSVLLYFNHFAKLDTILYGKIIREYITCLDNTAAITSFRHIDPKKGAFNRIQGQLIQDWHELFGINIIPVIQEKDKKEYPNADEFNRSAVKNAIRFLRQSGRVLAISPEGTRSKIGELLKAEEGLEVLFRLGGENVLAMPLAAEHSSVIPLATKTRVIAGKPFSYEEIEKEHKQNPETTITELMMKRLAVLLPPKNRGFYR